MIHQADSVAIVSGAQIRAARKLLGWSYATLAKKARRTLRLVEVLEAAGVEFTTAVTQTSGNNSVDDLSLTMPFFSERHLFMAVVFSKSQNCVFYRKTKIG